MDEIKTASYVRGFDGAAALLPEPAAGALLRLPARIKASAAEIRLGRGVTVAPADRQPDVTVSERCDVGECFLRLCRHSVYSFRDPIAQGFIPLPGGHRAGLCGTAVIENGAVTGMRDISRICIRIARQAPGCADPLRDAVLAAGGVLIAGAPCSGKTTVLRDTAYALASGRWGRSCRVAVIDCRGELCAVYNGVPQLDTGGSFVLDGYPKAQGMLQAVRCLAPDYIVCDEIGGLGDAEAVTQCANTGAAVIATVHAGSAGQLPDRRRTRALIGCGAFDTVVMLSAGSPGRIEGIYAVNETPEDEQIEMDRNTDDNAVRVLGGKRALLRIG